MLEAKGARARASGSDLGTRQRRSRKYASGRRRRWCADGLYEPTQPVGSGWEDDVAVASKESVTSGCVVVAEHPVSQESLDAAPFAPGRDPGIELAPRFTRGWAVVPPLVEDGAATEHLDPGSSTIGGRRFLDGADPGLDHGGEGGVRETFESGWPSDVKRGRLGHRTVFAKEVARSGSREWLAMHQRIERRGARPMVSLLDEPILDGIGQGVDHFLDDVGGVDEADDAGLLGRPEVLPSAAQRVLALGEELVKVLEESPRRSRSFPLPVSIDDPRTGRTGDRTSREIRPR